MKRKVLATAFTAALVLSLAACGGETTADTQAGSVASTTADTTSAETQPETSQETETEAAATGLVDTISLDNSEGTITYTGHEVTTDYDGNPALLVYYDYTNKKQETSYAQMTFYPQAFQNGVECQITMVMGDNEALSNATSEIMTGTTINIAFAYELQDETSPVTIQVSDQSVENLFNGISQQQEITLQ